MRGLFFKIFIIFWIAQSLIFVISTALIVRRHFEGPQATFDFLSSTMRTDAQGAVRAYESGGCSALQAYSAGISQAVALENASGRMVCQIAGFEGIENAASSSARFNGVDVNGRYVWRLPVASPGGAKYTFLLSRARVAPGPINWYRDLLRFSFPQLPVAIAVGGLMTFVLVLLFTRPLAQLRKAAGELARGRLTARVVWPGARRRFFARDEIQALMHDFNHMAERLESLVDAQKLLLRQGILNLVMHARGMPDTKLRALGCTHARTAMDIRPELYDLWLEVATSWRIEKNRSANFQANVSHQ